jgi:ABC-2 type transport system permease protein
MRAPAGTGALVRMVARRDRVVLPACVAGVAGYAVVTGSSLAAAYPTEADRARLASTIAGTVTYAALYGPARDLEALGGLVAWRCFVITTVMAALVSLLLVGRHTRAEEERGRAEMVRAGAVGRTAPITAAVLVVAAGDVAIGGLIALGLVELGLPAAGSLAFGAGVTAVGLVFAGVGAVAAQVTEIARPAYGLAGALLGLAYLLRAAGDAGGSALSWLSPIGWAQATRPFTGERWWPLLLTLAAAAGLLAVAYTALARRDLGAGLVPARPGPPRGGRWLRSTLGLALRLQRGALLAWSAALLVCGVVVGSVAQNAGDLLESGQVTEKLFGRGGGDPIDAFLAGISIVLGLLATGFTIQSVLRLRGEEAAGRAEPVLVTAVGRARWAGSHLTVALGGSAVVLAAAGLGLGVADALAAGDAGQVPRLVGVALVQLPAAWVLGGLAVLLFGLVPRAALVAWAGLGVCVLLWLLGPLLHLPGALIDVSPFSHLPPVPAAAPALAPLAALTAVAAALLAIGLVGFARRDVR